MSEEKSSPIGIIVAVAVIAVVAGIFLFKGGGNGGKAAGNQQKPTNGSDPNKITPPPSTQKKANGSDTNKITPPPSTQKKANGSDTNKTAPQPEPAKPEKPAEPEEPAFVKEGLLAYYPFNGNAKDESGNGHDGEVKGATLAKDRHGEEDKTYSFDGQDDFIEVADADSLDLGNEAGKEWTVTIWFKGNIKREGWLLRKGGGGGSRTTDYGVLASPKHRGFVWGTGRSSGAGGNDVTDWMAIPSNVGSDEWHHVVATYKQGALNEGFKLFYIDGQVAGSTDSGKLKNPANDGPLRIGAYQNRRACWAGSIDDVRIYNRALSEEQVKALYEFEKPKK